MTDIKFTRTTEINLSDGIDVSTEDKFWNFENWKAHKEGAYGRDGFYNENGGLLLLYLYHDKKPYEFMGSFNTLKEMKNYIQLWKDYNEK